MIKFINNSSSDITIDFYGLYNNIKLKPDEDYVLDLNKDSLSFKVSEYEEKPSFIMNLLKIVLLILFSIFLTILECTERESLKKSLKFSTKYEVKDLATDIENEVIIKNSSKQLVAFSVSLNGQALNGEIDITEQELKKQVKEYYEMEVLKLSFPMLALFALAILILLSDISAKIFISPLLFLIACIPLLVTFRKKKKNEAYINSLREKYCNSDNGM